MEGGGREGGSEQGRGGGREGASKGGGEGGRERARIIKLRRAKHTNLKRASRWISCPSHFLKWMSCEVPERLCSTEWE